MSRDCPVRYIITVNALKEGWDCPFAYVLATLANKSSVVDVTQILGRVLRMPYTRKHSTELLNLSYVFTASSQFQATLGQVVAALNKAGFSKRDYRELDLSLLSGEENALPVDATATTDLFAALDAIAEPTHSATADDISVDASQLDPNWEALAVLQAERSPNDPSASTPVNTHGSSAIVESIKAQAVKQANEFASNAAVASDDDCPEELKAHMNEHKMKPMFSSSAAELVLPQFFVKLPSAGGFFESGDQWHQLAKENLLSDFVLANLDATVNFAAIDTDVYSVDAEDIGNGESAPAFRAVRRAEKDKLNHIIRNQAPSGQVTSIVGRLFDLLGKNTFYPIDDNDVKRYLARIVEAMSPEQRSDCLERDYAYVVEIKKKIQGLATAFAAKEFNTWLATQKIRLKPSFALPASIAPGENAPAIGKSLYVTEAGMNNLEARVIRAVISEPDNVLWWHRNLERGRGFMINGYINHYPDFIVLTSNKNVVIIEAKGDDRDNSDSRHKCALGHKWAEQANQLSHVTGFRYHYIMVFENNPVDGAERLSDALAKLRQL